MNPSLRRLGTSWAFIGGAALISLACQARERRPVAIVPPPGAPAVPPGSPTLPGQPVLPQQPSNSPNANQPLGQGPQGPGAVPSAAGPVGPGGVPPSGPGSPNAATNVTISTTLEDGSTVTLEWDGKTFKGNDKWDVIPQQ